MSPPPLVFIDVDDVLLDTARAVVEALRHTHPTISVQGFMSHPEVHGWTTHPDVSQDLLTDTVRRVIRSAELPARHGAAEALTEIYSVAEVVALTARPQEMRAATVANLRAQRLLLPGMDVVCVGRSADKATLLQRVDAALIDDFIPCPSIAGKTWLFDRPWNRHITHPRVSWVPHHVRRFIREFRHVAA